LAGERPRRLREDVESRLTRAVDAWQLSDVRALSGGNVALVCAAVGDGRPVVLKLIPRGHRDDALLASEATTLEFWRPTGAAIELLAERDAGFTLLLEHACPGDTLLHSGLTWEEMLVELGGLARRLHAAGTPPPAIPR
jgi:Aminoglycoside/hydroxyurea antibiotic resistance kinase